LTNAFIIKNKSAVNRQRLLNRHKEQIKKAISDAASKRSITDIDQGERIIIPHKDITEPTFQHSPAGINERVFPGNVEFIPGDKIKRPQVDANDAGSQASNQGEGEDPFVFDLSREEFLDLYFEDLALPDLVRKQITSILDYKYIRAGFTTTGVPTNINIIRSLRQATARRLAIGARRRKKLKILDEELVALKKKHAPHEEIKKLQHRIEIIKIKLDKIPFIDTFDLRFNNRIKQESPSTQAVMFCLMDVSGSMDEMKKDIAKRFFILLYLFLTRNYDKIELVFIRHHTSAKQVDEKEFFYSRETGGTVVSSALELMRDIMQTHYSTDSWNIYAAQASDGDNWNADSPYCKELLSKYIIPHVQYYSYVEIMPRHHQSLWEAYSAVKTLHPNFAMQNISDLNDIYPVFRQLFQRQAQ